MPRPGGVNPVSHFVRWPPAAGQAFWRVAVNVAGRIPDWNELAAGGEQARPDHRLRVSYQRPRYVADDLQRRGRHLVDSVLGGVPVGVARAVVEVYDVDGVDAGFLQRDVVVDETVLDPLHKDAAVTQIGRRPPHAIYHLVREGLRVALV